MENSIVDFIFKEIIKDQKVYSNPSTTITIFRSLPFSWQNIIYKLLFTIEKINLDYKYLGENFWVTNNNEELGKLMDYFVSLVKLKVFIKISKKSTSNPNDKEDSYDFNPYFKQVILNMLTNNYSSEEFLPDKQDSELYEEMNSCYLSGLDKVNNNNTKESKKESKKSAEHLLSSGISKLDKFIEELIGLDNREKLITQTEIINFFIKSNYLVEEFGRLKLGNETYRLLLDTKQKILENVIKKYLQYLAREKPELSVNCSILLFELNLLEVGRQYKLNETLISKYSDNTFILLNHLGIIKYIKKKTNSTFLVTPLINSIFMPNLLLTKIEKFFYIETNFRIYLYPSKAFNRSFQYIMTKLLGSYEFEFEDNLVNNKQLIQINQDDKQESNVNNNTTNNRVDNTILIGNLRRNNVTEFLKKGISATQLIDFLITYSINGLNENIQQQIRMWEREVYLINPVKSIFLYDFETQDDYLKFMEKTVEKKIECLWRNDLKRTCCFSIFNEEIIKRLLK